MDSFDLFPFQRPQLFRCTQLRLLPLILIIRPLVPRLFLTEQGSILCQHLDSVITTHLKRIRRMRKYQ